MNKIKIIVTDDHPMVIEGIRAMLAQISFASLKATAANAYEAMEAIVQHQPDVVITDINLPEINGIELTKKIKKEFPKIKIVAMSTFNDRSYISQMIQNGADGYVVKSASKEEIQEAILSVYEGKMYMSVDINLSSAEMKNIKNVPVLSRREKEVLTLISEGLTSPQIAEKLFISLHTVDSHRKNLLAKFDVGNTALLIKAAVLNDMI